MYEISVGDVGGALVRSVFRHQISIHNSTLL